MDRNKNIIIKTSKILSLLLRHKPQRAGIVIDENGWTNVNDLIKKVSKIFYPIDINLLIEVVEKNDKKRFSFNSDQTKIRANQGHSIKVDLDLEPVAPPDILYHGTVEKFLESIKKDGLRKGGRLHVHLSGDIFTASKVGKRRGQPIILEIKSGLMHQKGFKFYLSENKVWLTDLVPPEFINFNFRYQK
jgi:putative RNA 2'-phosphotransferase